MSYDMIGKQWWIKRTLSDPMKTDIYKCDMCRRGEVKSVHCSKGLRQKLTEEPDTQVVWAVGFLGIS